MKGCAPPLRVAGEMVTAIGGLSNRCRVTLKDKKGMWKSINRSLMSAYMRGWQKGSGIFPKLNKKKGFHIILNL